MNEAQITQLLAERHARRGDIFAPQCKTGGTWEDGLRGRILDGWAWERNSDGISFTYEIKCAESDYAREPLEKVRDGMAVCNAFYFVTPYGLLTPKQKEAFNRKWPYCGLIETTKKLDKLRTVIPATVREISFPQDLVKYILTWRAEIR